MKHDDWMRSEQERWRRNREQAADAFRKQQEQWRQQQEQWRQEGWERHRRQERKPPTTALGRLAHAFEILIAIIIILVLVQFVLSMG